MALALRILWQGGQFVETSPDAEIKNNSLVRTLFLGRNSLYLSSGGARKRVMVPSLIGCIFKVTLFGALCYSRASSQVAPAGQARAPGRISPVLAASLLPS